MDALQIRRELLALSRRIKGNFEEQLRRCCEPCGLTAVQMRALVELRERPCTVGELGRALLMASGNISPLCKKLEREGYLQRRRDGSDERVVRLELTAEGRALADRLEERIDCRVMGRMNPSGEEMEQIIKGFEVFVSLLERGIDTDEEKGNEK